MTLPSFLVLLGGGIIVLLVLLKARVIKDDLYKGATPGLSFGFFSKNSSPGIPKLKPIFFKTPAFFLKNSSKFCKTQFFGNF